VKRYYDTTFYNHSDGLECPFCGVINCIIVGKTEEHTAYECQKCFEIYWDHTTTSEVEYLFRQLVGDRIYEEAHDE